MPPVRLFRLAPLARRARSSLVFSGLPHNSRPVMANSPEPAAKHTYGQILKSSALIGGSSVLNILIGIVRTKVMAVLLGPAGFGLMGLYGSIIDLAGALPVWVSAAAVCARSPKRSVPTDQIGSREPSPCCGEYRFCLESRALLLLVVFSGPVSTLTFGSDQHAAAVALLSLALLFRVVSAGQGALIQGMRRISDLAMMGVVGTVLGTIISIAARLLHGREGGSPLHRRRRGGGAPHFMVVQSQGPDGAPRDDGGGSSTGSDFPSQTWLGLHGERHAHDGRRVRGPRHGAPLGGPRVRRALSAAWTLGGLYVGIILQAMGADFYPRLVGVATE